MICSANPKRAGIPAERLPPQERTKIKTHWIDNRFYFLIDISTLKIINEMCEMFLIRPYGSY